MGGQRCFNTDQGIQFTIAEFTGVLGSKRHTHRRGSQSRDPNNVLTEQRWRSLAQKGNSIAATTWMGQWLLTSSGDARS